MKRHVMEVVTMCLDKSIAHNADNGYHFPLMNFKKAGQLFVVSGPSGVGKGTVIKGLLAANMDMAVAVSATTRTPRPGEIHGQSYYFLSDPEFDVHVQSDAFLEWCWVHDKRYGTLKSEVKRLQDSGHHVILEIDTQGAAKIKQSCADAHLIFIAPPKESDLEVRLRGRASDSEETITRRLLVAKKELACKDDYHIVIVNDVVDHAVNDILAYIKTKQEVHHS